MLWLFFLQSQYTAKELEGSRKGTEADEQTVSFSEVRRKLSGKAGKRGSEIWPQSQISSGHGGEVLQEFSVVCTICPFFLPSCFTSCHRGNKKPFVRRPPSPSCSPQALWRSIRQTTILLNQPLPHVRYWCVPQAHACLSGLPLRPLQ